MSLITRLLPSKIFSKTVRIVSSYSTTVPKEARELDSVLERNSYAGSFGQPTPQSHPHLLAPGEVVSGLQKEEFMMRREKVMKEIMQTAPKSNHIVVIPSANKVYMSEKIPYVFRQNSDFLYLTGCLEPDSALILTTSGNSNVTSTLFLRKKDKNAEKWDGPRTGTEGALLLFGVNQSLPFSELSKFLTSYLKDHKTCTIWYDFTSIVHPEVHGVLKNMSPIHSNITLESPKPVIHKERLIKSPAEQKLMARTCEIASLSMSRTMAATKPGVTEHMLFAKMDFECRMNGADFLAYPPVVAAGNSANTIHYISNLQKTKPGDMVLMDAGCAVSGYCSDLTRTWPVSGYFNQAQRVLYEIVLVTQAQLIDQCNMEYSLDHLFSAMCHILGKNLIKAGVFKKDVDTRNPSKLAYDLCPHHASHYLGMDVHDTSTVMRNIAMRPGMVITVEPGLYVADNNSLVHEEFRGQGIRIEDNILITDSSPVILTQSCPKDPEVVQQIVGQNA